MKDEHAGIIKSYIRHVVSLVGIFSNICFGRFSYQVRYTKKLYYIDTYSYEGILLQIDKTSGPGT
jgi:hypothetical protein